MKANCFEMHKDGSFVGSGYGLKTKRKDIWRKSKKKKKRKEKKEKEKEKEKRKEKGKRKEKKKN